MIAAVVSMLRPASDLSAADWVAAGVGPFGSGVRGLVPACFAAFARILHPAESPTGEPVRWSQVAAWSGGVVHSRVQFEALARPREARPHGPAPWNDEPSAGEPPAELVAALCDVLAAHTVSAERCWFCLWEGWGWITGSSWAVTAVEGVGSPVSRRLPPAFPPDVVAAPRVSLPKRRYLLFEGPLAGALELGQRISPSTFFAQPPNLFWPEDHAWCVATEIDLDSTYVGGSEALVHQLLEDDRLEALAVDPDDPVWADSDTING